MRRWMMAAALAGMAGPALANSEPPRKLAGMSAQAFAARAEIRDDPLEFVSVVSTQPAFRGGKAEAGTIESDAHLRAAVDRRTGETRYEVRKTIRYVGPRREYDHVHYVDGTSLRRVALSEAEHGADHCPNSDFNGVCYLSTTLAFPIDEALLRRMAAGADVWRFKFKDRAGADLTSGIVPAEAAGLLIAVDGQRQRLALADGDGAARP